MTYENVQLIQEMNSLRKERDYFQSKSNDLEKSVMSAKTDFNASMNTRSSPSLRKEAETPYTLRKQGMEQEANRISRKQMMNQLPPQYEQVAAMRAPVGEKS